MDPESTTPHTVPIIDLSQLEDYWYTPQVPIYLQGSTDVGLNCHCELLLKIPVIKEPVPTVALEGRWFIDYDIKNLQTGPVFVESGPQFQSSFSRTLRQRGPITFALNPTSPPLSPGTHSVEFLVAEKDGFVPDITVPPHHRALFGGDNGWDATVLKLVIDVRQSPAPSCLENVGVITPLTQRICVQ